MTEIPQNHTETRPTSTTNWDISGSHPPFTPNIEIDPLTHGHVYQGFYGEMLDGIETMGSDGFTNCSGLILLELESRKIIVAHLEPERSEWSSQTTDLPASRVLDDMNPDVPKELVLIQGDISSQQTLYEHAFASGNFGINSLQKVKVDSGSHGPWGFVFYKSNGELKVFSREDPGTISTYLLFPNSQN
jgi:hypothetical protein